MYVWNSSLLLRFDGHCRRNVSGVLIDRFIEVNGFIESIMDIVTQLHEFKLQYEGLSAAIDHLIRSPSQEKTLTDAMTRCNTRASCSLRMLFPVREFLESNFLVNDAVMTNPDTYVGDMPLFYSFFDFMPRLLHALNQTSSITTSSKTADTITVSIDQMLRIRLCNNDSLIICLFDVFDRVDVSPHFHL